MKKSERFELRADDQFLRLVEDWRRTQPVIPSVSEAIRSLVRKGIEAESAAQDAA
jgi:hypothetical protein